MEHDREINFCDYYENWIDMYKIGAIRDITLGKYRMSLKWLRQIAPDLKMNQLTRLTYQKIINEYAETHEIQTTRDFHHHVRACILDALDENLLDRDPTRKAVIKGCKPRKKKQKFLSQFELQKLLVELEIEDEINRDWLILLIAKTGMRFSEALALTPQDFDLRNQRVSINKTWDYKNGGGFEETKNRTSKRNVQIDWYTVTQFAQLIKDMEPTDLIFIKEGTKIFNSTYNMRLKKLCEKAGIPVITIHGLRHTHASILLFTGVSTASVASRLGHSSIATTQKVYLHIIQELEHKDTDLIMRSISGF